MSCAFQRDQARNDPHKPLSDILSQANYTVRMVNPRNEAVFTGQGRFTVELCVPQARKD